MQHEFFDSHTTADSRIIQLKLSRIADQTVVSTLGERLTKLLNVGTNRQTVVFDWGPCNYLSSSALGMFATLLTSIHKAGGRVVFCAMQPSIAEVLEIVRLDRLYDAYPNLKSALLAVDSTRPPRGQSPT